MRCLVALKWLQVLLLVVLLLTPLSLQCGPGRGSGRRRRHRKLTPLVYKQHVPNVSENTIGASGLSEGRITRKDPKFKNLVVSNENKNIEFKDEEGTGDDRIMSKRCKEKLNILAISVRNQWPGVKLRVTEAWDENGTHTSDSLHYEGRAVDITTTDRDRAKYGMLARLAVEAGFDWVFYESRSHIHCSVKSDSSVAIKIGGCFPSFGLVITPSGTKTMDELKIGDHVLSVNTDGQTHYTEVISFLDRNKAEVAEFYQIHTESGQEITLTPKHLIYFRHTNSTLSVSDNSVTYAENVKPGQFIITVENDVAHASRVTSVRSRTERGVYAPLTYSGSIVVNGVASSCYAVINNEYIAHFVFAPVRGAHDFMVYITWFFPVLDTVTMPTPDWEGVHWYARALYNFASLFLSKNMLYVP